MNADQLAAKAQELKDTLGWTDYNVERHPESFEAVIRVGMELCDLVGTLARRVSELELDRNLAEPVADLTDAAELAAALEELAREGGEPE